MIGGLDANRGEIDYEVKISYDLIDDEWDDFVCHTPGGHYTQTTRWAQVQAIRNWRSLRMILRAQDKIIAGTQILFRSLPVIGSLGLLSRGPVCDFSNAELAGMLINEIEKVRRQQHIVYMAMTLPATAGEIVQKLSARGYYPSDNQYGEIASTAIDLTQDIDTILARMTIDKRKTIHRIERRQNLTVREGTRNDIPAFHRLHSISSQRNGFTPHSESYYYRLWEVFEPQGRVKMFLSENEGEPISACICISFNDRVSGYVNGWSGTHGSLYPNDAMVWEVIRWAKTAGYHYFDFGGLSLECSRVIQKNERFPEEHKKSYDLFKLSFGGDVYFFPDEMESINDPFLYWGYKTFYPLVVSPFFSHTISRIYRRRTENQ